MEHAFFNRKGGRSLGIFKSLNCGPGSLDNKKNILKNLKIVQKKIKTKLNKVILLKQIHSNKFHFIDKDSKLKNYNFEGDALITNKKEFPIAILTADCAPILIYDEKEKMIAAIHAGWKGAFKEIIRRTLNFMIKKGCTPENITAVIGPCISVKNYEVKKDFIKKLIKKDGQNKKFLKKIKNKDFFNLKKYVHSQLKALNIKKIDIINKDTFDPKNNFFSARRSISCNENDYGRNISVIMIN
ncbi:peptidoglycan editing factor PgeF [Candidatus Pelagibacter sp. Uisw_136]|uniref:peptidoglycan editing factor PgeF n=1 Tax=Candidatus Pelagibacter sp. Uisw_136 TaxID=3230991 RepID=UPI0039EC892C